MKILLVIFDQTAAAENNHVQVIQFRSFLLTEVQVCLAAPPLLQQADLLFLLRQPTERSAFNLHSDCPAFHLLKHSHFVAPLPHGANVDCNQFVLTHTALSQCLFHKKPCSVINYLIAKISHIHIRQTNA